MEEKLCGALKRQDVIGRFELLDYGGNDILARQRSVGRRTVAKAHEGSMRTERVSWANQVHCYRDYMYELLYLAEPR